MITIRKSAKEIFDRILIINSTVTLKHVIEPARQNQRDRTKSRRTGRTTIRKAQITY